MAQSQVAEGSTGSNTGCKSVTLTVTLNQSGQFDPRRKDIVEALDQIADSLLLSENWSGELSINGQVAGKWEVD